MARFLLFQSNHESTISMANKVLLEEAVSKCCNVVISPLSIQTVLAFMALGSKGPTQKQLLGFLGLSSEVNLHSLCKKIVDVTLPFSSGGFDPFGAPILQFTNAVWLLQDFNFRPSFERIVKSVFKAESRMIDHEDEVDKIMRLINSWAANVSQGLITEILPNSSLSTKPALILANDIYFKGKWAQKFDKFSTQDKAFHPLNGGFVCAPFMTSKQKTRPFRQANGFKILTLPYQNSGEDTRRFAMYIFLPEEMKGLPNLIQMLNNNPRILNQDLALQQVELNEFWIPKFKFSYDFEASKTLEEMGLTLPFKEHNQDFDEMVISHKNYSMYLSKVFQKAFIEVDEEGTEAAVITACVFQGFSDSGQRNPSLSFVADHPFFFMIREETSRTVLFSGAVLLPLISQKYRAFAQ